MSHIRKISDIDLSDYASVVVVRGEIKSVSWSSYPPQFIEGFVSYVSKVFFYKRFGLEFGVPRKYKLILYDETGEIEFRAKAFKEESEFELGEEIIVCAVMKLRGEKPYLEFLKKPRPDIPNFLIRLSKISRKDLKNKKRSTFIKNLKKTFPEIFKEYPDVAKIWGKV
ncbi:MAG: hypothetical protein ACE5HW_02780 [Candidatus Methanofastidiosia archaeon]